MADAKTWAKRVETWRASGESASVFAAGRGFAPSTLRWWSSKLGRRDSGFVRVVTAHEPSVAQRDEPIVLELDGVRVLVRAGVDRATLAQVLDVLRSRGAS